MTTADDHRGQSLTISASKVRDHIPINNTNIYRYSNQDSRDEHHLLQFVYAYKTQATTTITVR